MIDFRENYCCDYGKCKNKAYKVMFVHPRRKEEGWGGDWGYACRFHFWFIRFMRLLGYFKDITSWCDVEDAKVIE